jgi:hypothetical protein
VNQFGADPTVTATIFDSSGNAVAGQLVEFRVTDGNNASGSATTNDRGQATFTYTGTALRDDRSPAGPSSCVLFGKNYRLQHRERYEFA